MLNPINHPLKYLFALQLFGCSDHDPQPNEPIEKMVFFGETEMLTLPKTTEEISNIYLDSVRGIVNEIRETLENLREDKFYIHTNYEPLDTLAMAVDSLDSDPSFEWRSYHMPVEDYTIFYQVGRLSGLEYFWNLRPWFIGFSTIHSGWQLADKSEGYYSYYFLGDGGYLEWSNINQQLIIIEELGYDSRSLIINLSDNSGSLVIDREGISRPIEENLFIEWFANGQGEWKRIDESDGTVLASGSW